jgi:hypothetical protein
VILQLVTTHGFEIPIKMQTEKPEDVILLCFLEISNYSAHRCVFVTTYKSL